MDQNTLFYKIFNKNKRKIFNPKWIPGINKWLEFINKKNELLRFKPRLNSKKPQIFDALAEIQAAYVIENNTEYKVVEFEKKTVKDKDVDFLISNNKTEIYCEVKSPGWEAELTQKERLEGRTKKPKYINAEARWVESWKNIQYAIIKAYDKFLPAKHNMIILCPDLFNGLLEFPNDLNVNNSLYGKKFQFNSLTDTKQKGCFADNTYENIGGLLIVEHYFYCEDDKVTCKSKYFRNAYAKKPFLFKVSKE
jgi:hypothetical protein